MEKNFIFAGLVPPEDIPRYLGIMDFFVHLSRREGLPRALPQALAASRPVIAYDCDGANEVCLDGETGFLAQPGDLGALAERVVQLAQDPTLRQQMGARGRDLVRPSFSVETMVENLCDALHPIDGGTAEVNPKTQYFLALIAAALATAAAVPFWRCWCRRHGVVDDPGHRKIHATSIPLAGGLAVLTGLIAGLLGGTIYVFLHSASGPMALFQYGLDRRATQLVGITVGAFGMMLIGLRDDTRELRPAAKFAGQLLAALVVAASGVRITLFVHNIIFSYAMTALWILAVVNAFNFMDNMNGLCAGLGAIGAACFGLVATEGNPPQYLVATMALLIAGLSSVFCRIISPKPPRSSAILEAIWSAICSPFSPSFPTSIPPEHPRTLAVLTPLLILGVPARRPGLGRSPALAHRPAFLRWRHQPFSHRLVRRGLSARQPCSLFGCWRLLGRASLSLAMISVDAVVDVLEAMASENAASASARGTEPINRFSSTVLITGTFRCSLASKIGNVSSSFWSGPKQAGTGRITSYGNHRVQFLARLPDIPLNRARPPTQSTGT